MTHAEVPKKGITVLNAPGAEGGSLNRSHNATGSLKHRDPRFPPLAFSEHGALMAAMVSRLSANS